MIRPARDKDWAFRPANLVWIFSNTASYVCLLILLWIRGTPKYLPKFEVWGMFRFLANSPVGWLLTFLEKNTLDFVKFTTYPELAPKFVGVAEITFACLFEASPSKRRSSAKNKYDIGGPFLLRYIVFHSFVATSWLIFWANLSIHNTKR